MILNSLGYFLISNLFLNFVCFGCYYFNSKTVLFFAQLTIKAAEKTDAYLKQKSSRKNRCIFKGKKFTFGKTPVILELQMKSTKIKFLGVLHGSKSC